jgi:hypothetical protein
MINLMVKVKNYLSLAALAALLLLCSIGFAQTKAPIKSVANPKQNTMPKADVTHKVTHASSIGDKSSNNDDSKFFTRSSFLIQKNVFNKFRDRFKAFDGYVVAGYNEDLFMLYNLKISQDLAKEIFASMNANRLEEKYFFSNFLPKVILTGDEKTDRINYGDVLTYFVKCNDNLTYLMPNILLEFKERSIGYEKLYVMQIEYGNILNEKI